MQGQRQDIGSTKTTNLELLGHFILAGNKHLQNPKNTREAQEDNNNPPATAPTRYNDILITVNNLKETVYTNQTRHFP